MIPGSLLLSENATFSLFYGHLADMLVLHVATISIRVTFKNHGWKQNRRHVFSETVHQRMELSICRTIDGKVIQGHSNLHF